MLPKSVLPKSVLPKSLLPKSFLPKSSSQSAADLTARQVSRFGAFALFLYPLLLMSPIRILTEVVPAWWTPTALTFIVVPSAAMFLSTFQADTRWTYRAAWVVSMSFVAVIASFPLVWDGLSTSTGAGAWLTPIAGVASVAAVVAMPIPAALTYFVVTVTATRAISTYVAERTDASEIVTDLAWGLLVSAVPFVIAVVAVETGRLRDGVQVRAKGREAARAAEWSRRRERARMDAITHDRIMSIIWSASREGTNSELQTQARATLHELDALRDADDHLRAVTPVEVIEEMEAVAAVVAPGVEVRNSAAIEATTTYPLDSVHAMASAMSEALHNSIRHAGGEATREVLVSMHAESLTVEISDDGIGFEQDAVPADRLGVALSIRGRMQHISGGSATITATPGEGTRVVLTWRNSP